MRDLLSREPSVTVTSILELLGLARAIEEETARRYCLLAREMDRRGASVMAATFRTLLKEQREHSGIAARMAERVNESLPPPAPFVWLLPTELAMSWDDLGGTTLLTPYRALSVAVANEQRAFSHFAYIAAYATDAQIAAAAEEMARARLRQTRRLRKLRRRAYHRQGRTETLPKMAEVSTADEFRRVMAELQRHAAREHAEVAARLRATGDVAAADLLAAIAEAESNAAPLAAEPRAVGTAEEASELLYRARVPLERLADACELAVARGASEELVSAAQEALSEIISRLAQLCRMTSGCPRCPEGLGRTRPALGGKRKRCPPGIEKF